MSQASVLVFHTSDSAFATPWLGYVVMPNGKRLEIPFFGDSEQNVRTRALAFWDKESARQRSLGAADLEPVADIDQDEPAKLVMAQRPKPAAKPAAAPGKGPGKGKVFKGKVWMINRKNGERARVDPAYVTAYETRGFVRGGPRSK
jgi:hypothetical protein